MNLRIYCQDGEIYETVVSEYNSGELNETINDPERITIEIGGLVFSRIDIKRVIPIEDIV